MANPKIVRSPTIVKNPLDWNNTWGLNQQSNNVFFETDENGNIRAMPVFLIQPTKNPVTAAGAIGAVEVADGTVGTQLLAVDATGKIGVNNFPTTIGVNNFPATVSNVQIYSIDDTATTTYIGSVLGTGSYSYLVVYIYCITLTGTSAVFEVDAVNSFTGITRTMTGGNLSLAAGTKYILLLGPFPPMQGTNNSWASSNLTQPYINQGPLPSNIQIVITKTALTAFEAKVSIEGAV